MNVNTLTYFKVGDEFRLSVRPHPAAIYYENMLDSHEKMSNFKLKYGYHEPDSTDLVNSSTPVGKHIGITHAIK